MHHMMARGSSALQPALGGEVSNDMNDALIDRVTLIPWGALLSIRGTSPEERGGPEGRLSNEQVAELARHDPT
jgi:hypothetical protein